MSLILEVYPVPWKILDLIKARILKNRAKKAKKGLDLGEDLKQMMSLRPGPLSRRRKDEPSFINSTNIKYTLELARTFATSGIATDGFNYAIINNVYRLYAESDDTDGKQLWFSRGQQYVYRYPSQVAHRTAFFVSTFANGDPAPPLIAVAEFYPDPLLLSNSFQEYWYGNVEAYTLRFPPPEYPGTPTSRFEIEDAAYDWSFSERIPILYTEFNPLHNWYHPPKEEASLGGGWGLTKDLLMANPYDISKISEAPGYETTAFLETSKEENVTLTVEIN